LNANNLSKDQIRSGRVTNLLNVVKNRKKRIAKANYEEKLNAEFMPFTLVAEVPAMERELFYHNSHSKKLCISSLRDRYMLSQSTTGILRGESLIKCELSDLCDVIVPDQGG
jgi:hypothetical protein